MAIDWGAHKQQVAQRYDNAYWANKQQILHGSQGDYGFDLRDKSITSGNPLVPSMNLMWSQYLKGAQSRGIRPDWNQFMQKYQGLVGMENRLFLNNLQTAQLTGMKLKDIKKSLAADPSSQQRLLNILKTSGGDVETQAAALNFLKKPKSGIMEMIEENPLYAGAAGVGAYQALKRFGPKLKGFKPGMGSIYGVGASGSILKSALEAAGIDEESARRAGGAGQAALAYGLGGGQAIKDVAGLGTTKGRADFMKRISQQGIVGAKGLPHTPMSGFDDLVGKNIPANIRKKITKYRKTKKIKGAKLTSNSKYTAKTVEQIKAMYKGKDFSKAFLSDKLVKGATTLPKNLKNIISKLPGPAKRIAMLALMGYGGYQALSSDE